MNVVSFGHREVGRCGYFYLKSHIDTANGFLGGNYDKLCGIIADTPYVNPDWNRGIPYRFDLKSVDILKMEQTPPGVFPSISYRSHNAIPNGLREDICNRAEAMGFRLYSLNFSPSPVDPVLIGDGCWIQENCNIQTGSELGKAVVCWAGAHVGHKSKIADFVWVTTHATICGECEIGANSFIGANAVVFPGVRVGKRNIIGSGAIITRDTKDDAVFFEGRNNLSPKMSWEVPI